jgi:hypothetical protein
VSGGGSDQLSSGEIFSPVQVNLAEIASPSVKAGLVKSMDKSVKGALSCPDAQAVKVSSRSITIGIIFIFHSFFGKKQATVMPPVDFFSPWNIFRMKSR